MTIQVVITADTTAEVSKETREGSGELLERQELVLLPGKTLSIALTEFEELTIRPSDLIIVGA